jgi:sugar O-acyltransferase (sialic acid O-acetyltransferase NeuD family)
VIQKVILYGGGGHAKVVAECLQAQQAAIVGFIDDNPNATLFEFPHLGKYFALANQQSSFVIAIGENKIRKRFSELITHSFVSALHPSALISSSAKIGRGSMIFHRVVVQADTTIGNHVILNTSSQIDHDSLIEDFAHIGPGAIVCGSVKIGEGSLIGAGSVILPGVEIGKWCTIAAGSVVTKSVPDGALVIGSPAKIKSHQQS